jgi:hypothetical protein
MYGRRLVGEGSALFQERFGREIDSHDVRCSTCVSSVRGETRQPDSEGHIAIVIYAVVR